MTEQRRRYGAIDDEQLAKATAAMLSGKLAMHIDVYKMRIHKNGDHVLEDGGHQPGDLTDDAPYYDMHLRFQDEDGEDLTPGLEAEDLTDWDAVMRQRDEWRKLYPDAEIAED